MATDRRVVEAVRERTDIVEVVGRHVTLVRRGANWVGLCPFHQEKTPSFNVLPARGIYHCFGCNEGGDVFAFLMKIEGLSFFEALQELGRAAGIEVRARPPDPAEAARLRARATLHEVCEEAARWFHEVLLARPEGEPGRAYLARRGITEATIRRCRLGFAPDRWTGLTDHLQRRGIPVDKAIEAGLARRSDRTGNAYDLFRNRLVLPIVDRRERPIAFGGRLLAGDGPKYINSPETPIYDKSATLYGLSWATSAIQRRGRALVVEGYFDVLALLQAGFEEAVATCGTALTPAHLERLRRLTRTVVALFDGDEAGLRAAERSLPLFLAAGVEPRHLVLPGAKDPDEFLRRHPPEALEEALGGAEPLFDLVVRRVLERAGDTAGGRAEAARQVVAILKAADGMLRSTLLDRAARLLDVDRRALGQLAGDGRRPSAAAPSPGGTPIDPLAAHLLWLLVHHAPEVGPLVDDRALAELGGDPELCACLEDLASGMPLPEVLAELGESPLAGLVRRAAAREGLYAPEQAVPAAEQILARLRLRGVERERRRLVRELERVGAAHDPQAARRVARELEHLRQEAAELRLLAGRARSGPRGARN